jgi:signal transduction histidine kinase
LKSQRDHISHLQSQEEMAPPHPPRWQRLKLLAHYIWTAISAVATVGLMAMAFFGPSHTRLPMGLLAALSLLMFLFMLREKHHIVQWVDRERYLWRRLSGLSQIFEVVLGVRSEEGVQNISVLNLRELMLIVRAEFGAIIIHSPDNEDHQTLLGFEDIDIDHRLWITEVQSHLENLDVNESVIVEDLDNDPRFVEISMMKRMGLGSFAAVKFGKNMQDYGLLVLGNPESREFGQGDIRTLEMGGRLIAAFIKHGMNYRELEERIDDLKLEIDELTYSGQLKSEFASVASHELKTPLTAIKGSVDTLLSNLQSREFADMEEFLLVIREEVDRLIEMTGKILEISSLDYSNRVMERRSVRLSRVVDSCLQALEVHLQEKDMEINLEIPPSLPCVFADADMIRQVLINLIGNAIKFSPGGQTISVAARPQGRWLEVEISDTGIGIPQAEQPHIFDRFYQGSRSGDNHVQSTGLGLAIVKQIVDQHQGTIQVESVPGEGARFTFRLPLARDNFGLKDSPLDIQPAGEVEEFLRLSVEWIAHITQPDSVDLHLIRNGALTIYGAEENHERLHQSHDLAGLVINSGNASFNLNSEDSSIDSTLLAVPFRFKGNVVGAFAVAREENEFGQEDLLLVEGVVSRISRVLEHSTEQVDPGRVIRRAMRAVRDLVQGGGKKSPRKVDPGLLGWELSTRIGVDRDLARDVRLAINFHDVAMSQIGTEIENQERSLSSEEQLKLWDHPRLAARLLEDIQAMDDVSQIVMHHHEWYDGHGYPDSLVGERIPRGSRIVAIIDAYCSMTAPRKYKPVYSPSDAARELVKFSGTQFDPQIITHFLEMLREHGWIDESLTEELLKTHARQGHELTNQDNSLPSVVGASVDNSGEGH